MFSRLNKQGVKSRDGFEVQVVDRFTVEYREGGKTMSIYVDGDKQILTNALFAKWNPPFAHLEILELTREEIRLRFNAGLKALNE